MSATILYIEDNPDNSLLVQRALTARGYEVLWAADGVSGIEKAETTAEWDTAFPLVHKIRPQDDDYWRDHRGTPKAFITLAAGQKMWANRFGNLTAIRFPVAAGILPVVEPGVSPGGKSADGRRAR